MLWLQKLLHPTVIVIDDGRCRSARGHVKSSTLRDIDEVLGEFGVTRGILAIDGRGRAHFSASIPTACHQRLRNLVLGL